VDDLRERIRRQLESIEPSPDALEETLRRVRRRELRHRIGVGVLALAVATGGLVVGVRAFRQTGSLRPAAAASNGPIWARAGGGEAGSLIYSIDPLTGTMSPLWSDGRNPDAEGFTVDPRRIATDYSFSRDGSRVAFSAYATQGAADRSQKEIFVMNADGSGLIQVTHDQAYAAFPSWSPDGAKLVYSSYRGTDYIPGCEGSDLCPANLYLIHVNRTGQRQLTDGPADESMPSWSPDGKAIVFRTGGDDSNGTLRIMNADGTTGRELTPGPGGWVLFPEWSPDGDRILVLAARPEERFGVWVVGTDGTGLHRLVDTNTDTTFGRPSWSPTGEEIAYARLVDGEPQLWVVNADGSEPRVLADVPRYGISPVAWQPSPASSPDPTPGVSTPSPTESPPPARTEGTVQFEPEAGVWMLTPPTWSFLLEPSGPVEPKTVFAVANFPIERGGGCAPTRALGSLPADGALAWTTEYQDPPINEFPPRPERFSLDPASLANYECSGNHPTYMFRFRDQGRYFQIHVAIGDEANQRVRDDLLASLSSLELDRCFPSEPPELVSESGTLSSAEGNPGAEVALSGPTGRDGNWFWSPLDRIEVWWSQGPIERPTETGTQLLLASVEPGQDCTFAANFRVPDVPPGRYLVTVLAYGPGGFGWMAERQFTVTG
jgi:Tol biopolymer transport system component